MLSASDAAAAPPPSMQQVCLSERIDCGQNLLWWIQTNAKHTPRGLREKCYCVLELPLSFILEGSSMSTRPNPQGKIKGSQIHLGIVLAVGIGGFVGILCSATVLTWRWMRALSRHRKTSGAPVVAKPPLGESRSSMLVGMESPRAD